MATKNLKSKSLTKSLSKREITVLAVYLLGGARKRIDTEDAAVKAAALAPGAFSWRKYPDQINLEIVRAVLSDAKKKQFGALLHGTGTTGWRLSDAGITWASQFPQESFGALTNNPHAWAGSSDARRSDRELKRVKSSAAWLEWEQFRTVSRDAARLLFRIDDYATAEMSDIKISRVRSSVAGDKDLTKFLDVAARSATDN